MKKILALVAVAGLAAAANAQVTPQANVTNGAWYPGTITTGTNSIASAPGWAFFIFQANAGDAINIEVDRAIGDLDPVSSVVFGDASGTAFAALTGTNIFNWSGPGLSAVITSGDDNDGPALPGPWGDPNYGFVAPSTGTYTVAVASYFSAGSPPYDMLIQVLGSTVPTPGSMALLGLGGLAAIRRRRA